ncbi:MAG TPA: ATP-binding cassette domain-containing protein [Treponemataceae bacterium]|nr:ATP-binding cassette domain-containing protein [Treponemataceae bacterium]
MSLKQKIVLSLSSLYTFAKSVKTRLSDFGFTIYFCIYFLLIVFLVDKDLEIKVANEYKEKLKTKCTSVLQNTGNLSGGNQQKVLLSKWMFADPDILILDEPTRGIDVGAKYEIYCIINQLVAEGKTVLFISSELPEILGMCDRVYVMNEGKMVAELDIKDATQEVIMSCILQSGKRS